MIEQLMRSVPIISTSFDDFIHKIANLDLLIYVANSNLFDEKEGIESTNTVLKRLMLETKNVKIIMVRVTEKQFYPDQGAEFKYVTEDHDFRSKYINRI
jgi:hypothetical protein